MKLSEASILFVDDEPGLRDIFEKWLLHAGCASVLTCADGEEALAALATSHFDLLISDIRMPRVDGITLVRRRWEAGGRVPCVIFVSGFSDIVPREMYALGVEAFLPKPTRREEFFRIIGRSLAERSELWGTPLLPPPRQFITSPGVDSGSLPSCNQASCLDRFDLPALGRGGFSLHYPRPVALGKVGFNLSWGPELPPLRGEGIVRWRSREQRILGVEFEWLEPACREAVLNHIATTRPRSYIPDFIIPNPVASRQHSPALDKSFDRNSPTESTSDDTAPLPLSLQVSLPHR